MELVEAGFAYLNAGLSILALEGKVPNGRWHPHGFKDAFRLPSDWMRAFSRDKKTTGIGIVIPEGACVVDVDGEEGAVALLKWIGDVPDTPTARTGRGLHLWFATPAVRKSRTGIRPRLDVKASGYVVAPPSRHPETGTEYEWLRPIVTPDGHLGVFDWLPDPIERAMAHQAAVYRIAKEHKSGTLDGLVNHLRTQAKGNRSDSLYWAACCAREDGFPLGQALAELVPAIVQPGYTAGEAEKTIRSAYGGG